MSEWWKSVGLCWSSGKGSVCCSGQETECVGVVEKGQGVRMVEKCWSGGKVSGCDGQGSECVGVVKKGQCVGVVEKGQGVL